MGREFGKHHVPGTSDVQYFITYPSSRTLVRGEEPHPFRGATIKYGSLFWLNPSYAGEV